MHTGRACYQAPAVLFARVSMQSQDIIQAQAVRQLQDVLTWPDLLAKCGHIHLGTHHDATCQRHEQLARGMHHVQLVKKVRHDGVAVLRAQVGVEELRVEQRVGSKYGEEVERCIADRIRVEIAGCENLPRDGVCFAPMAVATVVLVGEDAKVCVFKPDDKYR